jgi:cytochrome oxidase Cu insertion factor (SCO1/SenC/PrrC family)
MNSGRKSLLWLLAVFVAPIVIGSLLFFNLEKLGFEKGSVNYGTLIQPPFPAQVGDLLSAGEMAVRKETIAKKWTMLYVETGECDQACQTRLKLIKRIRILMNEQLRRVRTTFVSSEAVSKTIDKKLHHDMVLTQLDEKSLSLNTSTFLKQLPHLDKKPVYLLDPLGNLMMYYPQESPDIKKMIKDLLKLLKYSRLG